jgi:hypothetical protein
MRALRRTQHLMSPPHYLKEYDLAAPAESVAARPAGAEQLVQIS